MPTKETHRAAKHAPVFGPAVMPGFWENQLAMCQLCILRALQITDCPRVGPA
jgi:hypothetical protein